MIYFLVGLGSLVGLIGLVILIGPFLPAGSRKAIRMAKKADLPNYTPGDHGVTERSGVKIWYETYMPNDGAEAGESNRGKGRAYNGEGRVFVNQGRGGKRLCLKEGAQSMMRTGS